MRLAAVATAALVAVAGPARANPYEAFIDIETEDDLADLLASGQISDETYEALDTLLARGVDLERASREELYSLPNLTYDDVDAILAYRDRRRGIGEPAELVAAGVLTERKFLAIAAFLVRGERRRDSQRRLASMARAVTRWTVSDDNAPPLAVQARAVSSGSLSGGVAAVISRYRLGNVVYDPNRGALLADGPQLRFDLPKLYVRWRSERVDAIAGSYRIGFGERLVFDTSGDYTPHGLFVDDQITFDAGLTRACTDSAGELDASPCAGAAGDVYTTPDFRWRSGLFGAGAGLRLPLPRGLIEAHAWGSWQPRAVYQYEIYDRGRCQDPHDDKDPACAAPLVFRRPDGGLLEPTSRFSYQTLPDVFAETVAGSNVTYFADHRTHLGVTGYVADTYDLVDGIELDYQEWSSRPDGGRFGTVGITGGVGRAWLDAAAELAHSFDAGGGGPAAIVRATAHGDDRELEASLRWYSTDFLNPFARPIAAADRFEGQRARDETGAQVRYTGRHGPATVRGGVDAWLALSTSTPKLDTFARADVELARGWRGGVAVEYQDKDLGRGGRGQCFEAPTEMDESGEPIECAGQKLATTARLTASPTQTLSLTGQVRHQLLDDAHHADGFRHDLSAFLIGLYRPVPRIRLRARTRYLNEDVGDNAYLEHSLSSYLDVSFGLRHHDLLRVRGDVYVWLDERAATVARSPSPEIGIWLEYQARY